MLSLVAEAQSEAKGLAKDLPLSLEFTSKALLI